MKSMLPIVNTKNTKKIAFIEASYLIFENTEKRILKEYSVWKDGGGR